MKLCKKKYKKFIYSDAFLYKFDSKTFYKTRDLLMQNFQTRKTVKLTLITIAERLKLHPKKTKISPFEGLFHQS